MARVIQNHNSSLQTGKKTGVRNKRHGVTPCKPDPHYGIMPVQQADPALLDCWHRYLHSASCCVISVEGRWQACDDLDGSAVCGIGVTPKESVHNAMEWLESEMTPTNKPHTHKTHRTYWVATSCTSAMLFVDKGMVVWSSAESWKRICTGRPLQEALQNLKEREREVTIRKVLPRYYFNPPLED